MFDTAAARNAVSPATPVPPGVPAATSAQVIFVATVRFLTRDRFDESVAKHVIRKCFRKKHERFSGTESYAQLVDVGLECIQDRCDNLKIPFFNNLASDCPIVRSTIRSGGQKIVDEGTVYLPKAEAFGAEDAPFAPLFNLEDATAAVRPEANKLIFSTLKLIICPASPAADWLEASAASHLLDGKRVLLEIARSEIAELCGAPFPGTSDLLDVRFKADTDPSDSIADFNATLKSARRKNTLDDDEVKEQFITALDSTFYAPVAGTHAGLSAAAITDEGSVAQLADVTAIILDVKKQLKTLTDKVNGKDFTPRADKGTRSVTVEEALAYGSRRRTCLPGGIGRRRTRFVAFHKGSGTFIPFCANDECRKHDVRHWHRDCPNGGKSSGSDHFGSFSLGDIENDLLAEQFQVAMSENSDGWVDTLCVLAGGKPEMFDDVSTFSFGVAPEGAPRFMQDYMPYCQPATQMGGFSVADVAGDVAPFTSTRLHEDAPPAPPRFPRREADRACTTM
ncbi:hypothetical protein CYMTET_55832 [Cymbomonas tetramitiformis]|uniref:Uncharacterized protein n=1 Tax=Cymbomonas tetramitiformis TaxID=36881 RepID=A0AAE0EN73_9CHLO|nr:hypothetical protein CYMTET_55832 [Cymbomonas tetramitiformis]